MRVMWTFTLSMPTWFMVDPYGQRYSTFLEGGQQISTHAEVIIFEKRK